MASAVLGIVLLKSYLPPDNSTDFVSSVGFHTTFRTDIWEHLLTFVNIQNNHYTLICLKVSSTFPLLVLFRWTKSSFYQRVFLL